MTVEDALAELGRGQGTQFDPQIVEVFCEAAASGVLNLEGKVAIDPAAPVEPEPITNRAAPPNEVSSRRAKVAAALVLAIFAKLSR
jgi:hypothetical protein